MGTLTYLTADGRITLPEDVRDALDLKPGEPVEIDWRGGNDVVIRKATPDEAELERRREVIRERLRAAAEKYAHLRTGRSTDEYMAELREELPIPSPEDV